MDLSATNVTFVTKIKLKLLFKHAYRRGQIESSRQYDIAPTWNSDWALLIVGVFEKLLKSSPFFMKLKNSHLNLIKHQLKELKENIDKISKYSHLEDT